MLQIFRNSLYISSWITVLLWQWVLCNSMKLWAMPCRVTQEGWVIVESSDKMWSTGGGNSKPLQYSCRWTPMNSMKRPKDTRRWAPQVGRCPICSWGRVVGNYSQLQKEWRVWAKEEIVHVSGGENKVWCYKDQYCIGTCKVRSMDHSLFHLLLDLLKIINCYSEFLLVRLPRTEQNALRV